MVSLEQKIESTLDRFNEAHWYIHQMEEHYHFADPFRYSLNAYIKSLKEIPQLLQMELQNETGFKKWFISHKEALRSDPLISYLSQIRDFVVHRGMLLPLSEATVGLTEGRGIKIGLGFPFNPIDDSDIGMLNYLYTVKHQRDVLQLLKPDEESLPCVYRQWKLEQFQDNELIDLASKAWVRVGEVVSQALEWLGGNALDLSLSCRHPKQDIYFRLYERKHLKTWIKKIIVK